MKKSMIIHPEELSQRWIDRLADAGVEILGIHPHGGNGAKDSLAELVELTRTDGYRALIDYARARGIEIEYEIHNSLFDINNIWYHSMSKVSFFESFLASQVV